MSFDLEWLPGMDRATITTGPLAWRRSASLTRLRPLEWSTQPQLSALQAPPSTMGNGGCISKLIAVESVKLERVWLNDFAASWVFLRLLR
jgi:hypothetical protein